MASCGQSWLLGRLRPGEAARLELRLGGAQSVLRRALSAHHAAISLAMAALRSALGVRACKSEFGVRQGGQEGR